MDIMSVQKIMKSIYSKMEIGLCLRTSLDKISKILKIIFETVRIEMPEKSILLKIMKYILIFFVYIKNNKQIHILALLHFISF